MKTPKSLVCLALSLVAPWAQAIELIGQTVSLSSVNVVAEVNGVIETMDVEVGDKVQQYTVIAEIKKQDFQFELARTTANLELAQAELKLKRSVYERYQELIKNNNLSVNELDIAKADYLNAKALVKLAQIELDIAQKNFEETSIRADIEGFVVSRDTQVGAWVNQGDLLYRLVNIDTLTVRLLASEHDMSLLSVGQSIELWAETSPEQKVVSSIARIGVEMDVQHMAYPIEVDIKKCRF
ncbi:efflux RND transporter periplasmic adaptor subunit [Vibrio sp. SCSIO 43133]|uniref:efflux RND transporter periplasmic adaptor subunit n=1 Tax=Vibrio sp. SCSIO 43133 TaxID=2802577 RepID=UPI002074FE0C|nr:efflux RND transporter periplasmic adaptor subunit [Vibrio sp. SCSIO 43133]